MKEKITDSKLLEIYRFGFEDELEGLPNITYMNPVLQKAYSLGRLDAMAGDDLKSIDSQTDEQLLALIKK